MDVVLSLKNKIPNFELTIADLQLHLEQVPDHVHERIGYTKSKAFKDGVDQAVAMAEIPYFEAVEMLSKLRGQWIHTEFRDKCFEILKDTPFETPFDKTLTRD